MANRAVIVHPGGGYENVVMGFAEAEPPQHGEITVCVHANSLNYHDYAVVSGMWGPTVPRIPMADGAGEVVAVGEGVTEFKLGDAVVSTFFLDWSDGEINVEGFARVPGDGVDGYAREMVTAPVSAFTRAPIGWAHTEAATLTTAGLTAWRALMVDARIKAGDTVLIQGTGGVSIFALQFAKMAGAQVIATSSNDAKLSRLTSMGADHVINYKQTPAWGAVAREMTGGRGVDLILDVGGPNTLAESMVAARVGGHISLIGILSGVVGEFSFVPALVKQLKLQGLLVGSRTQQLSMVQAINVNGMKPIVDKTFALEQLVEAFQYQEKNQHIGKICLAF